MQFVSKQLLLHVFITCSLYNMFIMFSISVSMTIIMERVVSHSVSKLSIVGITGISFFSSENKVMMCCLSSGKLKTSAALSVLLLYLHCALVTEYIFLH